MVIDPLLLRIISLGFALLFLIAATHKFSHRDHFLASFEAYEIVPANLSGLVAKIIPPLELFLGAGWLALGLFSIEFKLVTLISIGLLASYALAIGVNLKRGRNYIDCGCSFSSSTASNTESGSQQISSELLYRNVVLIVMAIVCTIPVSDRSLQLIDVFGLLFSVISLILLYGTFNQLLTNKNTINSWRRSH
ncbi:MAG: hypothetical protein COB20_02930 [SAR86 cluster bacterium]|uniref:Methylamine utilization protein MauE n=1 Tax=SAR86 cluster bacterium TaxID=2030880 RepID=A0A2A4XDE8_9GAMM|nr:MAG: hypothetical protein COB20_02930 [SAR86 cluster bacterium]